MKSSRSLVELSKVKSPQIKSSPMSNHSASSGQTGTDS